MDAETILAWVAVLNAIFGAYNYYTTHKLNQQKASLEQMEAQRKSQSDRIDTAVQSSERIQKMYQTTLDDLEARWKEQLEEQERATEKALNGLRKSMEREHQLKMYALEEKARQDIGVLLVRIEELKNQMSRSGQTTILGDTGDIHDWDRPQKKSKSIPE